MGRTRVSGLVRPSSRSPHSFDLVVLGGGSAGFAAAIRGAELGARVALVERGVLGGTCVNVGCVPSKTLIRAAEAQHRRTHHGFDGIPSSDGRVDWERVRAQKDRLVDTLRVEKYAAVLEAYEGIQLLVGRGKLQPPHAVLLDDGTRVDADAVLIATGASPWVPPIPGLGAIDYLDNASAMALDRLPASLAVLGGSAVGLELAQMFARLGVMVSVLEALPRIMPAEEPDVGEALAGYLRAEGLRIFAGAKVERVERASGFVRVVFSAGTEETIDVEKVLVATGRRANTAGLGLEEAGVALGSKGEIMVDEYLQTSIPAVYAAGDVIGDPMFVYVAAYAGALAAENALSGNSRRYDVSVLPRVTFTDPAVASVGLSEDAGRAAGIEVMASTLPLSQLPRARAAHDVRGFVKLVADARSRRLIGAHILAPEAGEMVTEAVLAIRFGLNIEDLTATLHPYLTLSEGIRLAAQGFSRDVAKLSCCA
ncbi:MAG TPA: mercury(II) reductase [Gemmatimonadaceae bacterium]|nr:mercury(II) reductase [Gemmatimonadaceae bacterium]